MVLDGRLKFFHLLRRGFDSRLWDEYDCNQIVVETTVSGPASKIKLTYDCLVFVSTSICSVAVWCRMMSASSIINKCRI